MLLMLLLLLFLWNRIVILVQPGQAGVLFRAFGGTEIDYVYAEGVHFINPLNTMHIYEVRKQVALQEFEVLTNKGLSIKLSLAIRYQPELDLLGLLHQRIGPDYAERVIVPQIESVMRKQLGLYSAEDIYTNKEGLLTNAILLALDEVGRNYVQVEDIIIRSITLPERVKTAIEEKLTEEETLKAYEFRMQTAAKEAERLRVEAQGISEHNRIIDKSLSENMLKFEGISATRELAKSNNSKVVVIGAGKDGLPIILGNN
ncbi:MAG: prohibitin family protein [Rhodocyclaceae bacterium]|nr:prohibitin family protein [Rhodocyclaceae bacterium]